MLHADGALFASIQPCRAPTHAHGSATSIWFAYSVTVLQLACFLSGLPPLHARVGVTGCHLSPQPLPPPQNSEASTICMYVLRLHRLTF